MLQQPQVQQQTTRPTAPNPMRIPTMEQDFTQPINLTNLNQQQPLIFDPNASINLTTNSLPNVEQYIMMNNQNQVQQQVQQRAQR